MHSASIATRSGARGGGPRVSPFGSADCNASSTGCTSRLRGRNGGVRVDQCKQLQRPSVNRRPTTTDSALGQVMVEGRSCCRRLPSTADTSRIAAPVADHDDGRRPTRGRQDGAIRSWVSTGTVAVEHLVTGLQPPGIGHVQDRLRSHRWVDPLETRRSRRRRLRSSRIAPPGPRGCPRIHGQSQAELATDRVGGLGRPHPPPNERSCQGGCVAGPRAEGREPWSRPRVRSAPLPAARVFQASVDVAMRLSMSDQHQPPPLNGFALPVLSASASATPHRAAAGPPRRCPFPSGHEPK